LHSIEKIIAVLECAPLTAHSEPSFRVIADRWRDTPLSAIGAFERGGRYNDPALGTSYNELVSTVPSRFILNARKKLTPTQQFGTACFRGGRISALKVPSAQNAKGYCLDIFIESLVVGERVAILDKSGRLKADVTGWIPKPDSR
jgi:hypothetical protein